MNEPVRWLKDPKTTTKLLEVLHAAPDAPVMPLDAQVKVGAYAAGLLSTGLITKSAIAAVGTSSTLSAGAVVAKAALVVALLGTAGMVGYSIAGDKIAGQPLRHARPASGSFERRGPAAQASKSGVAEAQRVAPISSDAMAPSALANASPDASSIAVARIGVAGHAVASAVAALDEPSIADEARLLELARSNLGSNPALALEYSTRHLRLHTDGQLSAERELIAVDALLRLGRRTEAEVRAAPRLQQSPDSLYARRLRQLLESTTH